MGVLDTVFGGSNGLVNVLSKTLGGTATIQYVTPGTYNEADDSQTDTITNVIVPFLPTSGKYGASTSYPPSNGGFSMAGGLMFDSGILSGSVPYSALNGVLPTVERDRIIYLDKTYSIKDIVVKSVGDTKVSVEIIAK